jgi:hypothetical protein
VSIFDGVVTDHGCIVVDAGDETDPRRTHRCVDCRDLFTTADETQARCGRDGCKPRYPAAVLQPGERVPA